MLRLQDWTKSEPLACLDWLSDTVKANGQQDPQRTVTGLNQSTECANLGGKEDLNEL